MQRTDLPMPTRCLRFRSITTVSVRSILRMNENITPEAAQELWDHRGYVFKAILLSKGSIKLKKKEYAEVYRKYFKNNRRSSWRMQAFLGGYYWQRRRGSKATRRPNCLKRFTPICRKRSRTAPTLWSDSSITRTARLTLRSESPRCLTRRRSNTTITAILTTSDRRLCSRSRRSQSAKAQIRGNFLIW